MARFSLKCDSLVTGASANTYTTLLGLKFAATTGHRGSLRRLVIGGANVAVQDVQVAFKIDRTNIATDGTATTALTSITKGDPLSIASRVAAAGKNYSAEPTTYDGLLGFGGSFNSRGGLVLEWGAGELVWGSGQTLGILAAPGAATATTVAISLEWDE